MHVLLTGATGLIGRPLMRALAAAGHSITLVSRTPGRAPTRAIGWDGVPAIMSEVDAVVNMAGEPVAEGRWTDARKQAIRSEEHTSELQSLRHLVCRLLLEKKKKN